MLGLLVGKLKCRGIGVTLGSHVCMNLSGECGGGVRLPVEPQRIGCNGGLAAFDSLLRLLEVTLEVTPIFVGLRLAVPFSDIASEDGGAADDDEPNVD